MRMASSRFIGYNLYHSSILAVMPYSCHSLFCAKTKEKNMMKTKQTTPLKYARFGAALCSLILVIMEFLPYWESEGKSVSIAQYQWIPKSYKPLTKALQEIFGKDYSLNSLGGWSIAVLVFGAVSLLFLFLHRKKPSFLDVAVFGFVGISGILTVANPVFRTGALWVPFLIVSILMLVFTLAFLAERVLDLQTIEKKPWEQ